MLSKNQEINYVSLEQIASLLAPPYSNGNLDNLLKKDEDLQYNFSFKNAENAPERDYSNNEINLEYIASLDYFPHNAPKNTVVKRESRYNIHIINSLSVDYQIVGLRPIAQDTGCNVVYSSEESIGDGEVKRTDGHEIRHNEIHNEYMNRCQDKAEGLV